MASKRGPGVMRMIGWIVAAVVLIGATAAGFIWFVVPKGTKDEFRAAHGLREGLPEQHVVPEGYTGWVVVKYDVPETPELPMEDGVLVFRYPAPGTLETSSGFNPGVKRKEYFSYGPAGQKPLAKLGPNRRIWGAHDLSHVIEENGVEVGRDRESGFFVGTREEYGEAKLRAPHLLPGMEPREGLLGAQ